MPENWSVKDIAESWFGSPATWFAGAATIAGLLSWLGIDKKLGFDIGAMLDKAKDFFTGLWNKLLGTAESTIDPESATMNKAIASRIDADASFAAAEKALDLKGIGKELRDLAKEQVKEGGDPIKNAQALREKIVAHITDKWQDANPEGDPAKISDLVDQVATGITGVTASEQQPRVIKKGYAGLMQQAKAAKDEEGTLAEGDVKPITLSPELKALADAAAAPIKAPADEASDKGPPPVAKPQKAASAGK